MANKSQRSGGKDGVLSALNMEIDGLKKEVASATPVTATLSSVATLLTIIRDTVIDDQDYVDLGLFCADICKVFEQGVGRERQEDPSKSVGDAMKQFTVTVAEIQNKVIKRSKRHGLTRFIHSRSDKDVIAAWVSDLNGLLLVFNAELIMNTHTTISDMRQDVSKISERAGSQNQVAQNSALGVFPPPPPRFCCGRDVFIDRIVSFVECLTPIALIGAGGIGKTSIILTALHDDRIKQRFGQDRRFIRCDEFPPSRADFLRQLSKVTGAGIENPKDLRSLQQFLSPNSKEILIVLDNAESILDPRGPSAQEIYAVVDELTQLNNVCVCITSRISKVPTRCKILEVPTLSMVDALHMFYRIYKHDRPSNSIGDILEQLDFHPLSIRLLATVAQHNGWETDKLRKEWEEQRTGILDAQHSRSLAATIELSLASAMFQELDRDARSLLKVVAFLPRGVNEKNTNWLFPTIPNVLNILDTFCILSLTYRNDGFITMLAPLRDHLRPKDPASSPLLVATKKIYFTRLSGEIPPDKPDFTEAQWITTEDTNVEHLLDVFTTIDAKSEEVWDLCAKFMAQLFWHKPRLTTLGPKIEALPDNRPSKAECLWYLSRLFDSIGNPAESKRLLSHALKLCREQKDDHQVARTLRSLSDTNRRMGLLEEGIQQAKDASKIFERLDHVIGQAECSITLAWLLRHNKQLDAAKDVASPALRLLLGMEGEEKDELWICRGHRVLGEIHQDKGETKEAVRHYTKAFDIATSSEMVTQLFWIHFSLMLLFSNQHKFSHAQAHAEHAKFHAANNTYLLARAADQQARLWVKQHRFEEARTEAWRALDKFESLGAVDDIVFTRQLLQQINTRTT